MNQKQLEVLFVENCGLYASEHTLTTQPNKNVRVIDLQALVSHLIHKFGQDLYQRVMGCYQCKLDKFLKTTGRDIVRSGLIQKWQQWNFDIMTYNGYINDKRHQHGYFSLIEVPEYFIDNNVSMFVLYLKEDRKKYEAERASMNKKHKKDEEKQQQIQKRALDVERNNQQRAQQEQANRGVDAMTDEILDLCNVLTPTQQSVENVESLKKRIQRMLDTVWPGMGYKAAVFGSSANCLALHNADVDLCILVPEHKFENDLRHFRTRLSKQPRSIYNMYFLAGRLKEIGMREVEAIGHATVPIVKFVDPQTGYQCDINAHNVLGIENTEMIQTYCDLDTRIRPLMFAIKHFVKQKCINNPRGGTLSSYAYVIMVLHFLMAGLQQPVIPSLQRLAIRCTGRCNYENNRHVTLLHNHQIIRVDARYHDCLILRNANAPKYDMPNKAATTAWKGHNSDSVSTLVRKFFQYYINPAHHKEISIIKSDGTFARPPDIDTNGNKSPPIIVQDPFIVQKNVARSCTAVGWDTIFFEFRRASNMLVEGGCSFADVCDPTTNRVRPVDIESMEYRHQQKQNRHSQRQSQASGSQQGDKFIGFLDDRLKDDDIPVVFGSYQYVVQEEQAPLKTSPPTTEETVTESDIHRDIKEFMSHRPQSEQDRPCMDMNTLIKDHRTSSATLKDVIYLQAQLEYYRVTLQNHLKGAEEAHDQILNKSVARHTALQNLSRQMSFTDEDELADERKQDEYLPLHCELEDPHEEVDSYEIYSQFQWYGQVLQVQRTRGAWRIDISLSQSNIEKVPHLFDFGAGTFARTNFKAFG